MQTLRAGLYARVSTSEQQTLPLQMIAMQDYAQRRGWTVVTAVQDVNGGTEQRPKRGEDFNVVACWSLQVRQQYLLPMHGRSGFAEWFFRIGAPLAEWLEPSNPTFSCSRVGAQ